MIHLTGVGQDSGNSTDLVLLFWLVNSWFPVCFVGYIPQIFLTMNFIKTNNLSIYYGQTNWGLVVDSGHVP